MKQIKNITCIGAGYVGGPTMSVIAQKNPNINECFSGTEALEVQPFDAITPSPGHSVTQSPHHQFDAIILTVAHKEFLGLDLNQFLKEGGVVYDVKGILENVDSRL